VVKRTEASASSFSLPQNLQVNRFEERIAITLPQR
jgi:hypothetical protein